MHSYTVIFYTVAPKYQVWEFAHFLSKNERPEPFAQQTERFTHSLILSERPEPFTHDRSFPLSNLSELLMVAHFW